MFKCQRCDRQSRSREKSVRVITNEVQYEHPSRPFAHPRRNEDYRDDPGGSGPQIVQELTMCGACVAIITAARAEEQVEREAETLAQQQTLRVPMRVGPNGANGVRSAPQSAPVGGQRERR